DVDEFLQARGERGAGRRVEQPPRLCAMLRDECLHHGIVQVLQAAPRIARHRLVATCVDEPGGECPWIVADVLLCPCPGVEPHQYADERTEDLATGVSGAAEPAHDVVTVGGAARHRPVSGSDARASTEHATASRSTPPNDGMYFETGSSRRSRPSSTSTMVAAASNGFRVEAVRNRASVRRGVRFSRLAYPSARLYAICPWRATIITMPATRPSSMYFCISG